MQNMSNEVDYRLAKILYADMCRQNVIHGKRERQLVKKEMLSRYNPPLVFLECDDKPNQDTQDLLKLIESKVVCGRCGRKYGVRPWHSTTYNYRVLDCLSRNVKKGFCGNSHIYEDFLPEIAKSITELLIKKRHSAELFLLKTHGIYDDMKLTEAHRYLGQFLSAGLSDITFVGDNLNYIIEALVITDDVVEVKLVDGASVMYDLPLYRPGGMRK